MLFCLYCHQRLNGRIALTTQVSFFIYTEKRVGFGSGKTRVIKQVPEQKSSQFGSRMKLVFVFVQFYFAKVSGHLLFTRPPHHTHSLHQATTPTSTLHPEFTFCDLNLTFFISWLKRCLNRKLIFE